MSSILLGPLANTGVNSKSKNKLNSVYNSNISDSLAMIEKQQARQKSKKPEFLKQFNELTFDNIGEPVSINESYISTNGIDQSLQRNLDFLNGYSDFQQSDMHYDVVTKDNFTHNNMIPNTSRRDFSMNLNHADRAQRKLETFTGIDPNYVSKKEKAPLFEPMPDLSWVNGMPVVADKLVNRYLPSNKNNYGNLPFESGVKVRPGIEFKNQEGDYAVYRVNPRNVDSLRSETKPLETIKKGEIRAPEPTLSKYKLPDFRQTDFGDLLPSRANIEASKKTGTYTNVTSQRNETETYYAGHAVNTNYGDGPDKGKIRFEPAKRESYVNDPTHAINAVNNKPVMTNTGSYTNYETQRASTNVEYEGSVSNALIGGGGNYTIDYKDVPLTTLRELMINGDNNIGIVGSQQQANYIFSNDMVLPTTHRETTSHNIITNAKGIEPSAPVYNLDSAKMTLRQGTNHSIVMNARGEEKQVPVYNDDPAKMTLRPGTNHSIVMNARGEEKQVPVYNDDPAKMTLRPGTNHSIVMNARGEEKQVPVYNEDPAKMTLRPGTNHSIVMNARGEEKQVPVYNEDPAKMTLRPGTSHNLAINIAPTEGLGYSELTDQAKKTIRQTTSYTTPEINIKGMVNKVYTNLQDQAKPTIKQTTLISKRPTGNPSKTLDMYTRDVTDEARPTIRQTTENTQHVGHVNAQNVEASYVRDVIDEARPTIRQTTENTQHIGHINAQNIEAGYTRDKEEKARPTIRQTTENTIYIGHINAQDKEGSYTRDVNDEARPTIKQTTLYSTPAGRMNNSNMGNYARDKNDKARVTIKQTTLLEDYTGGLHGEIDGQISHQAADNMEIDDRREISTYNRTPNGKGDLNGPYIDKENVRMNDRRELYNYVSHPHKSLDMSVMPTTSRDTIQNTYSISKPVIETSTYYVNPYFINTLKNNPLVNDIYHQKNV